MVNELNSRFFGKRFSILGDSISTLEGYIPKDYCVYYSSDNSPVTGVYGVKDTWWGKVIDRLGGELLVNNSWSGSRVTKLPYSNRVFPSGCSNERTGGLHKDGLCPDIIIIYLGTNDWAQGVNPGNFETIHLTDGEYGRFDIAYEAMLNKVSRNYPNAEIWCLTLCASNIPSNPGFSFPHAFAGIHIEKYNEVIRTLCRERKNTRLVDLYGFNTPYASLDGAHPTAEGMDTIASLVVRSTLRFDDN